MDRGEQLNQTHTNTEVITDSILVSKLSEELLFTLENLERQARALNNDPFALKRHKPVLDCMIEDAHHMDGLLKALKKAVKALKSELD